ncbi:MAG: hypothetical protein K0R82_2674 [Flavipsychrobacter sp.]|nr:hypothetical protein [Flavipsychrobacter sp.]
MAEISNALAGQYEIWTGIVKYVYEKCPVATDEWSYSKFGWNYRVKDRKRVIIYLMPCDGFFRASFVLGQAAYEEVLKSKLPQSIKDTINAASVYAEGRGFRIDVHEKRYLAL